MQTAETFDITASAIQLNALDAVTVGTTGAVVELSGAGEVEYVSHVWRSSSTFEEFTNAVPAMTDVTEVFVRGVGASVESAGGAVVRLSLGSGDDSSSFVTVWDSTLGAGAYSMDGLHVTFGAQSVSSVRLSVQGGGGLFVGWDEVVFHFGQSVSSGSVRVSSSSVLEAVSGESLSVSSESVSVSAGGTLDVSGGESVRVVSDVVRVESARSLDVSSSSASLVVSDDLDVFSGGAVSVSSGSAVLESSGDVTVSSGSALSVSSVSASLEVSEVLDVSGEEVVVRAGDRLSAYSGESVSLSTEDASFGAGRTLSAFAGEQVSVASSRAVVQAAESLRVSTGDL